MAKTVPYTPGMLASALKHYSEADTWTRARRKRDRLDFVVFPARTGHARRVGRVYNTTTFGCTCDGHGIYGICSHLIAVQMDTESRKRAARRPNQSLPF